MEQPVLEKRDEALEDYLEKYLQLDENKVLKTLLKGRSRSSTKSVTIRLSEDDIETMKNKASKLGIPYQTYIKMVIHKDACEK